MRILIISRGMPDEKYPLNGIFAYDQAKALRELGHEVFFISIDFRSFRHWRRWGMSFGNKNGIRWCSCDFPLGRIPNKYHRRLGILYLKEAYKRMFKTNGPDIIHAHFTENESAFLSKHEGLPLVITEHSSKINSTSANQALIEKKKQSYSQASALIAVSCTLSKNIEKRTGFKPLVIPNIINVNLFEKCKKKPHVGFRLATTSNLIPLKRTYRIIEAMRALQLTDIYLDVIGSGSEMSLLHSLVERYNLSNRVVFHGTIPREKIVRIYENCDCFIMVSSSETFGVCYAEALSSGLPVIATKCGGPEDFINRENGVLVEVDNQEQINNAISYMYGHYKEFDTFSLRKNIADHFSPYSIARQLDLVYSSIVNND